MSNATLPPSTTRFMEDLAALMAPWGWSPIIGRIFAYLLVREQPATLDEIANDLGIAKSSASIATRELADYGNAVRIRQPGTKQLLYAAPGAQTGPFFQRATMMRQIADMLDGQREIRAESTAGARLASQARFMRAMSEAILGVIEDAERDENGS